MAKSVVGFIPHLISALLVFALGYLAALLTRERLRLFLKSLSFDRYSQQIQMLPERAEDGEPILTPSQYASRVAYWIVLFSFFLVGLDKLTLHALSLHGGTVVGFALGVLGVSALGVGALLLSVLVHRIVRGTAARGFCPSRDHGGDRAGLGACFGGFVGVAPIGNSARNPLDGIGRHLFDALHHFYPGVRRRRDRFRLGPFGPILGKEETAETTAR